ncbi:MAG TPA: DUF885 domain-containing protein [Kineosporiaceae bacterium]|nr:DUF885 domain-containing protein [Kineosporiaceae bacterium]
MDGTTTPPEQTPRRIADAYVDALVELDPVLATSLGAPSGQDRWPDWSPDGAQAQEDLRRRTLAELDAAEAAAGGRDRLPDEERRCARLLRERLEAHLAVAEAGEELRRLDTLFSPPQSVRQVFTIMPTSTDEQWETVAARLERIPEALLGYRRGLAEGRDRQLVAGPRQVEAVVAQLGGWARDGGWFSGFARTGPEALSARLQRAGADADAAVADLRAWLAAEYAPAAQRRRDPVGREAYRRWVRYWSGADLDVDEAYAWGWTEYARLDAELRAEAQRVLPGSTPKQAMAHLDRHGPAVEGVEAVRQHLQGLMDGAISALDGVHFDLAEPVRRVESMIAPEGAAAAPYYMSPSEDFSRPGRTWLPTMGRTRFPLWDLVSTWYHEGVPGHHLQLAQWVYVAPQLSRYQTGVGSVSANAEGWALYAERLMDELGFLGDPAARLGYLDAQQMRAVRVVVDIGMHLELPIPADQGVDEPFAPGETWTPQLAREFFGRNSGRPGDFLDSEIVRYLGWPGQAIGYKLGERAWLAGRDAARRAHGASFDAKAWHMAALSQGSLGLDDLVAELAAL